MSAIDLPYTHEAAIQVLTWGIQSESAPHPHQEIADWCHGFWAAYLDVETSPQIEKLLPIMEDVDAQWELFLANSYTLDELSQLDASTVKLHIVWFSGWLQAAET